ncbi:MAG TPA: T9SS type A sorting domain-containing protein [Saprospiraceae bacterium]|nr:T9SS type A sorting domain-containing protein [Saprospiraceae bacterium]
MRGKIKTILIFSIYVLVQFFISNCEAQNFTYKFVPSGIENDVKALPFFGGVKNPQFSNVDLNLDGKDDLVVFDKLGSVILPFVSTGSVGDIQFVYAPEYRNIFPKFDSFLLFRDYNFDGIKDIFTLPIGVASSAIAVYKGKIVDGKLTYELLTFPNYPQNYLHYLYNANVYSIYNATSDVPGVEDIDGDGDLDILSFDSGSTYIVYYQNMTVEEGLDYDVFKLVRKDPCWGKFVESGVSDSIFLSDDPAKCYDFNFKSPIGSNRHAGSTILPINLDGDDDMDILIGDTSSNTLIAVFNGGTSTQAWATSYDNNFPSLEEKIDISTFLAAFYVDVNNDQVKDLLVAPNISSGGQTYNQIWLYLNRGSNNNPDFHLTTKNFLSELTYVFGVGSFPEFVDYNNDGLMDILVGSNGLELRDGTDHAKLTLLKNIGTKSSPNYIVEDDNFLGLKSFSDVIYYPKPAFGDLDGDGDDDLVLGTNSGYLIYYENQQGDDGVMNFESYTFPLIDYVLGNILAPTVFDLNGDGHQDLVIGENNNYLNYYQNNGDDLPPFFEPDVTLAPNTEDLGGIFPTADTKRKVGTPKFLKTKEGLRFLIGFNKGNIEYYQTGNDLLEEPFQLIANLNNFREGNSIYFSAADIDNDELYEFVIGNDRGGISFFDSDIQVDDESDVVNTFYDSMQLKVSNPVLDEIIIKADYELIGKKWQLLDVQGKIMKSGTLENDKIDVKEMPSGVYFLNLGSGIARIIKL